ncbi:T9SS type A sorting domain-containing protein [Gelidibacter gilvus]|uniref:T9SS type A sorting domain-containing protein n=1 Tax=Gelidibacter gilvus TaxID=59602 RepID=A0A4Q0XBB7_9FLAO|nr:T9SS type A sorting domain-containing protein [Gelidibacter gilvus]RXJ44447.1 T9SS type A sorting domain-containing protein [Gelidibacter gilvus]
MKTLYLLATLAICQISLCQNGLYISSGGALHNENSVITVVDGDFVNESATVLNGGTLQMKGLDGNPHDIELSHPNTIDYLELYGTSPVALKGQVTLNRELFFNDTSSFNLTTASHVTLGPTAEIVGESNTNPITGADGTYIKTTRNHTAGITNDFGLIGVVTYNGSASMGSTEIYRRYGALDINGNATVKRYYEINPTVNSGLNIETHFYISDVDLNGLERSKLAAYRSTDNGVTFTNEGGTPETFLHAVTNIDAFSIWAFADASTLSINPSDLEHSIWLFPNPANNQVNITSQFGTIVYAIELFYVTGQKISTPVLKNNTFDVGNLSDGIYYIKIQSQYGATTKKLMVKK